MEAGSVLPRPRTVDVVGSLDAGVPTPPLPPRGPRSPVGSTVGSVDVRGRHGSPCDTRLSVRGRGLRPSWAGRRRARVPFSSGREEGGRAPTSPTTPVLGHGAEYDDSDTNHSETLYLGWVSGDTSVGWYWRERKRHLSKGGT